MNKEKQFLNEVASTYFNDLPPYSRIKKDIIMKMIEEYLNDSKSKKGVQMGCSNGYETSLLADKFQSLDVVDGSNVLVNHLISNNSFSNVKYIYSLFEEYELKENDIKYDYIIANYIMEHVLDSNEVLKMFTRLITDDGYLFIVVPNANALSRKLALSMGLLYDLFELTSNDHKHGHRRVYTTDRIKKDLIESGWDIVDIKGVIFKILADFQLNELLSNGFFKKEHILGLQKLSEENLDYCDSIFIVAKKSM
jgi:2-polyprenyl-3-methyl-5-hydroxy-6-metoxy-1,4-benzoquinol methylase